MKACLFQRTCRFLEHLPNVVEPNRPMLSTPRLVLRDFTPEDWPAIWAYQNKPAYLEYYEWESRTPEAVQAFVQQQVANQREHPRQKFQFVVQLKSTGKLIGNCGIRMRSAGACEADIGYEFDPAHWRQGYATEAAALVLAFGFTELRLHRIWASCLADNRRSARVLEKLGMRLEGRLRENQYFKDRWWDSLIYAVLDHEWQARQKPSLKTAGASLPAAE
jgi:RimJ/RimL family protein N-acetyltransferase